MRAQIMAAIVGPGGLALMVRIGIRVAAVGVDRHAGRVGIDAGTDFIGVDVHLARHGVDVRAGIDLIAGGHLGFDAGEDLGGGVVGAGAAAGVEDIEFFVGAVGPAILGVGV